MIFDTDMGELNDDAINMFQLLQAKVHVLGLTTVAGNTWAEEGTAYALRQLELIGRSDVPVYQGADDPLFGSRQAQLKAEFALFGSSGYVGSWDRPRPSSYLHLRKPPYMGYPTTKPASGNAVDFIVNQVKRYPHQVTLFVLGPMTNVALAVKKNPEIVPLVKQVIYMCCAINVPGNTTPAAEFNVWYDPEAAKIVLNTPFAKQLMVPLDTTNQVVWTKTQYDRVVAGASTPIKREFKALQGPLFKKNPKYKTFVYDSITGGVFRDPGLITQAKNEFIDVDTTMGLDYGRTLGYVGSSGPQHSQRIHVVLGVNVKAFFNQLISQLRKP